MNTFQEYRDYFLNYEEAGIIFQECYLGVCHRIIVEFVDKTVCYWFNLDGALEDIEEWD